MDQKHQFRFFSHTKCEYFPCHAGADPEQFNCLFCYCPLYALGNRCGGQFTYTPEGFKDCSSCLLPHHHHHRTQGGLFGSWEARSP